jgi:hypothetical protein
MMDIFQEDFQKWVEKYKPLMDEDGEPYAFETYDEDIKYVIEQDEHNVWTVISDLEGEAIVSGKHFVNRIHHYITEKKWEEFEQIILVEREIEYYDDEFMDQIPEENRNLDDPYWVDRYSKTDC